MSVLVRDKHGDGYMPSVDLAQEFLRDVRLELNDIKCSYFKIAFRLVEANKFKYYQELGYESIADLAEAEFGLKQTVTYNLMQIYEFAHDPNAPMSIAQCYEDYEQTKLLHMTRLKYSAQDAIRIIKPSDSERNINKFVKLWNKHYGCLDSEYRNCKTVAEYLAAAEQAENKTTVEKSDSGQLPGQQALELPEIAAEETHSTRVENSAESHTTDEIISECMRRDAYKNDIYRKYLTAPSRNEFIKYIKERHGTHGGPWYYGGYTYREYSPSTGIKLTGKNRPELIISWFAAACKIRKLIEEKQYRTEDELGHNSDKPAPQIPLWQEQQVPETVDCELIEPISEETQSTRMENSAETEFQCLSDNDIIDYCLKEGTGTAHGKACIFEKWQQTPTREEFKEYVKDAYGEWGGWSGNKYHGGVEYSRSNGITIIRKTGGKLILGWMGVAVRIINLITQGKYVTQQELDAYENWKQELGIPTAQPAAEPAQEAMHAEAPSEETLSTRMENVAPARLQTNREYLAMLSSIDIACNICLKLSQIMAQQKVNVMTNTVIGKLGQWLDAQSGAMSK